MLTGRQNARSAFLQCKKADLCFFPAFCMEKGGLFFCAGFLHRKLAEKVFGRPFHTRKRSSRVFFCLFALKTPYHKKKTVVLCSKRKVRVVFVSIIAILPDEFRPIVPSCFVIPLGDFL